MASGHGRGSKLYVKILVAAARACDVDPQPLLDEVGIRFDEAERDEDSWFPREAVYRLWQRLAEVTGDDFFGLHVAERLAAGTTVGVLEYAARHAATLGDAFRRVERYGRLVHDGAEFIFEASEDGGQLAYDLPDLPEGPNRHAAEWAAASWVFKGRDMTGRQIQPVAVRFKHPQPRGSEELDRVFGCPISFHAERTEVTFTRDDLEAPVRSADAGLLEVLDTYAAELTERLPKATTVEHRVRHYLVRALSSGGEPGLSQIAKALAMSPRTLQRRLKEEGATHRELVDEVRHSLALRYIDDESLSIGEIAFLLGFSEPSAFLRAFRRWTGTSPGRLRSGEGGAVDAQAS